MLSNVLESSQIDASLHSPALLELLGIKVSRTLIGASTCRLICQPILMIRYRILGRLHL